MPGDANPARPTRLVAALILAVAASLVPVAAPATTPIAEVVCQPTGRLTDTLTRQFGERLQAWGTRGPEQVMQVWTDGRGGWTLVVSYATGTSCIVAMGDNWEDTQPENPA